MVTTKALKAPKTKTRPACPWCGAALDFIGSVGIDVHDGMPTTTNDAQADRYDCPNGHTTLMIKTERIT